MTKGEEEAVNLRIIHGDGLEYTLMYGTDFPEIRDTKFHELRQAYIKATQEFLDYIDHESYT